MTVEELIVYGKSKIHSDHAKMLLADLLNINSLELLNYLDKVVDKEIEEDDDDFKEQLNNKIKSALNPNIYGRRLYTEA